MAHRPVSRLNSKKKYLQVALNGTLEDARDIIRSLPVSDRIIVEAGTPLIKRYGEHGIRQIRNWYEAHLSGGFLAPSIEVKSLASLFQSAFAGRTYEARKNLKKDPEIFSYVVADLKVMDRGSAEVEIAARAGASAAVALGSAPIETLNSFIDASENFGLDAMIDMMNVSFPLAVLHKLPRKPTVVILHRGVDEERFNKESQIPLHEIRRIKSTYNMLISIAGGDTLREVQRAVFNDADIVVVWKSFYQKSGDTGALAQEFLDEVAR